MSSGRLLYDLSHKAAAVQTLTNLILNANLLAAVVEDS